MTEIYPDINASAPLDDILWMFFKYDFVCIRNMLPPRRVTEFYERYVAPVYRRDDETTASGYEGIQEWENKQIRTGWVGEDRLCWFHGGKLLFDELLCGHLYTRLADRLMGSIRWQDLMPHAIRLSKAMRIDHAPDPEIFAELNALWMWSEPAHFALNFWTPLTEDERDSPYLEFYLATPEEVKRHGRYDPSIPIEPKGPYDADPRLTLDRFFTKSLDEAFGPERRWSPDLRIGDVVLFSHWTAHRFCLPDKHKSRVFLKYIIEGDCEDSPLRKIYSD